MLNIFRWACQHKASKTVFPPLGTLRKHSALNRNKTVCALYFQMYEGHNVMASSLLFKTLSMFSNPLSNFMRTLTGCNAWSTALRLRLAITLSRKLTHKRLYPDLPSLSVSLCQKHANLQVNLLGLVKMSCLYQSNSGTQRDVMRHEDTRRQTMVKKMTLLVSTRKK